MSAWKPSFIKNNKDVKKNNIDKIDKIDKFQNIPNKMEFCWNNQEKSSSYIFGKKNVR